MTSTRWLATVIAMGMLPLAFASGCRGEFGEEGDDFDAGPASASETSSDTTGSSGSMSTGVTSGSTGVTSGSTEVTTTGADSSTGPDEPVVCTEDLTCNPGEVCVLPCCGGPAPGCFPMPKGGDCGTDTPDPGGVTCCELDPDPVTCMMTDWCIPGPCMANPPYCTPAETITCSGAFCDAPDGCYGNLQGAVLQCSCQ